MLAAQADLANIKITTWNLTVIHSWFPLKIGLNLANEFIGDNNTLPEIREIMINLTTSSLQTHRIYEDKGDILSCP